MQKDGWKIKEAKKEGHSHEHPSFRKNNITIMKTETPWGLSQVPLDWFNMDIKINIIRYM